MKTKIAWILLPFLTAFCWSKAFADAPPADPNTPPALTRLADGFHPLDNGTAATFYDALHGLPLIGAITTPYKKYYCSLDVGMAYATTHKGQDDSSTFAEFVGGIRFHAGEFVYDRFPRVAQFVDAASLRAGLLRYAALGAFYSRDWTAGQNRLGPYGGFEVKF